MADEELRDEYDFRAGIRGKYAARCPQGSKMVMLDSDVAELFPTSRSVNNALRAMATVIRNCEKASRSLHVSPGCREDGSPLPRPSSSSG